MRLVLIGYSLQSALHHVGRSVRRDLSDPADAAREHEMMGRAREKSGGDSEWLQTLDDRPLADIGLGRSDIRDAVRFGRLP